MKGLFFSDQELTPDQAFIVRRCNSKITRLWHSFLATRMVLVGGLLWLCFLIDGEFIKNLLQVNLSSALVVWVFAIPILFFNPLRLNGGKLDCSIENMLARQYSLEKYQINIYAELLGERAQLESAGLVLEPSDWDRRIRLAFDECQLTRNVPFPVTKAPKEKHPTVTQVAR
jgi:hypothetical protein